MIIFYELIDLIQNASLNAEVSFDRFGKGLRFIGLHLSAFVVMAQCCIVALTIGLEKVFDFAPILAWIAKLIELQNFSQLACVSTLRSPLTCFCNYLMCVFTFVSLI